MPDGTYDYGVPPGQGANTEDMAGGRKNPAGRAVARVGNYAAPVDTTGLDPVMKQTMGFIRPPAPVGGPAPKPGLFDWLFKSKPKPLGNVGIPSAKVPEAKPAPMSQDEEDRLSAKYLGGLAKPPAKTPMPKVLPPPAVKKGY